MEAELLAGDLGTEFPIDAASVAISEGDDGKSQTAFSVKEDCVSTSYLLYLATPFVVTVILYFWAPNFVIKRTYTGIKKIAIGRFLKLVVIITLGIWVLIYIGVSTGAIQKRAEVCARRE